MPDGNQYREDFPAWANDQAQKLRQASMGNTETLKDIDFEHIIEELEALGRSEILRLKSLVRQVLAHLIKITASPEADAVAHWEREVLTFTLDASDGYSRAYRQRIDTDGIWEKAKRQASLDLGRLEAEMPMLPETCPVDLDWMMGDDFTVVKARAIVASAMVL